jgi:hypothetical protein
MTWQRTREHVQPGWPSAAVQVVPGTCPFPHKSPHDKKSSRLAYEPTSVRLTGHLRVRSFQERTPHDRSGLAPKTPLGG